MKIKFMGILSIGVALKAVENDGYALQYVLNHELFVKVAEFFKIDVEI